jgi:predicted ATPase
MLPVLDLLSALVEKSLVAYDDRGDQRYRLLETVRQYGQERLSQAGEEAEALRRRHAEYFAGWVEQSNQAVQLGDQTDWLEWYGRIDTEYDNLRAALGWAVANDASIALRLTGTLVHFWVQRSRHTEGCRCLGQALEAGREASVSLQAKPLAGTAWMELAQGDLQRAMSAFSAALARSREVDDPGSLVMALTGLSQCSLSQGRREQAAALSEQSLAVASASGDEALIEQALCACSDCRCAERP